VQSRDCVRRSTRCGIFASYLSANGAPGLSGGLPAFERTFMKRLWVCCAVLTVSALCLAGCNDYGNTFQSNTGAVISTLSPSNVSAGGPDFTLTITGAGFVAKTVVQWNGKTIASTTVTDTAGNVLYMTATVPAALTATPGTAFINTLNPHSGSQDNGLSNTLSFIVNPPANPVPVVSSISPSLAAPGSATLTLTIAGSSFLPASDPSGGSVVHWNRGATQFTLPATSISASQIQATVDSTLLATEGCAVVSVFNPPAAGSTTSGLPNPTGGGGGTSASTPTFTISTNPSFCPAPAVAKSTASSAQSVAEETPSVSADGRYVAYTAVQDGVAQVFLRDTCTGADSSCQVSTTLLSVAEDGTAANSDSRTPSMNSDGRYVAFSSAATNLASSAPDGRQIYIRDTCIGASSGCSPSTRLVSEDESGRLSGADNILPSISASGRFVAFLSVTYAKDSSRGRTTNAAPHANSGLRQVFVRDTCLGAATSCTPRTTRISLQPGDTNAVSGAPAGPALSGSAAAIGISGVKSATVFTRTVPVDDRVFLAVTNPQ